VLFEKLISVSGIGPTLPSRCFPAWPCPNSFTPHPREVDRLVRIPGVGKKTAERMVLELRDKMPAVSGELPETTNHPPPSAP